MGTGVGEMVKDLSITLSDCSVKLNYTGVQRAESGHIGTLRDKKKMLINISLDPGFLLGTCSNSAHYVKILSSTHCT